MIPSRRMPQALILAAIFAGMLILGALVMSNDTSSPLDAGAIEEQATSTDPLTGSLPPGDREDPREPASRQLVAPASTTPGTSLLVRVVRFDSGEAMPGFSVTVVPEEAVSIGFGFPRLRGVTDARGEVLWENVEMERVAISPSLSLGWFNLEPGRRNERIHEVDLSFTVRGRVLDTRGQVVPDADVWSFQSGDSYTGLSIAAVTDRAGSFAVPVFSRESVYLFARHDGAPSRVSRVTRMDDRDAELILTVGDQSGVVLGEIVNASGAPIAGASVRVLDSTSDLPARESAILGRDDPPSSLPIRTDAAGGFRLEGVAAGQASVRTTAKGYAGVVTELDVIAGGTSQARIVLTQGARIVGTILDTLGEPVRGVVVTARQNDFAARSAVTDRDGTYALENVQPAYLILTAMHGTRGRASRDVRVADGEELRWEPVFSGGAELRGMIRDSEGNAMREMRLSILGEDRDYRQLRTDEEGRFTAVHCKDQDYEVTAHPSGSSDISLGHVRPGPEPVELWLPALPTADAYVTGRFLTIRGEPLARVVVSGRQPGAGSSVAAESTADGTFRVGPFVAGEWTLRIHAPGRPTLQRTAIVVAGQVNDLGDVQIGDPVPVEISVRKPPDLGGAMMAQVTGSGIDEIRAPIVGRRVDLPPLGPGEYVIQIMGENVPWEVRPFTLAAGRETRLEIELQSGVPRDLKIELPEGVESSVLTISTFSTSGQQLVTWRARWFASWGPGPMAFRPEAVRLVVVSEDDSRGEARLESDEVKVVLR